MSGVDIALYVGATLGEGPVWVDGSVWFVDIKEKRVHRFEPASGIHERWAMPDQVGWVLPADKRRMIVGLRDGLYELDPATGVVMVLHRAEPDRTGNRLNDAATDRKGRLWFGTMDDNETENSGRLYRIEKSKCVDSKLAPVAITNGPAFNAAGTVLYHTDTLGRIIWRVPVHDNGKLGTPVPFVEIEDGAGYPDGTVVDSEDCLWTGLFGGWGVRRYDPRGRLIGTVRFPTANVTKICFGGPGLKTAYATTARKGLDAAALATQPSAGDLFAFDPGVSGLAVTPARLGKLGQATNMT
jgi:sugar lactone lactonase YvrE